jgi:hypothetical protein
MAKPIDEGFTEHTFDSEAAYRQAMAKSEEYKRAAEVGQPKPDPVSGGPYTPGHAQPGH